MHRRLFGLVVALCLAGICGGEPPRLSANKPQVFAGKVVSPVKAKGKPDRLVLKGDDGTTYPIIEDAASRMLFLDSRLRDRPVRLTALRTADGKGLQVIAVQTVKDGKVFDVDYWCEICQISHDVPGDCVCCGDDVEFRERPAR